MTTMTDNKAKKTLAGLMIASACVLAFLVGTRTFGFDGRHKREPGPSEQKLRELSRAPALHDEMRVRTLGRAAVPPSSGRRYATDRVLVRFRPGIAVQNIRPILRAYGSTSLASVPQIGLHIIAVPEGVSVTDFLSALQRNPDIESARPDPIIRITVRPGDKYFESQYALSNTGQVLDDLPDRPQCTAGADITATGAWDQAKGDAGVIIAVLDTGLDMDHPDIENKLASRGKDFINNDDDATDDHWHGTHVAGIAAADTNNSLGIAGVAWNCKVLPGKIIAANGEGDYGALIRALYWATDQGAQVINLSLGGEERDEDLLKALKYAYDKNVVVVAAAGNESGPVLYPAAYDDYCLAVAATDYNDKQVPWSNFGPEVDVAAPGVDILSLYPTWDTPSGFAPYAYANGTSMATPHVAGFAALIKSLKPWLTVSQVMNVIRYSSDDVNSDKFPGKDDHLGYGRINMERALVPYELNSSK
jgi:subtilisin family serine protease